MNGKGLNLDGHQGFSSCVGEMLNGTTFEGEERRMLCFFSVLFNMVA